MKEINKQQLEQLLRSVKSDPSREWKDKTLLKLENIMNNSEQDSKKNPLRRIFTSRIFISSLALGAFAGIMALALLIRTSEQKQVSTINNDPKEYLSEEEEKKILSEMILKNSILTESTNLSETKTKNNYRHTVYEMRQGPAYTTCLGDKELEFGDVIYETYEFAQDDNIFSIWSSKLIDGTQIRYELTKNKPNSSEWIRYRGGNFALREFMTVVASEGFYELPDSTDFQEIISNYGVGYSIYTDENGDYVMEKNIEHWAKCEEGNEILSLIIIDSKNFEIKKYVDYLVNDDSKELISESIATVENKNISIPEADELFKFNSDVEIINLQTDQTIPDGDKIDRLTRELFRNNDIIGLTLPEEDYFIEINTHAFDDYSQVYLAEYYARRDYYPSGQTGDSIYNSLKNKSEDNLVSMSIRMRSRVSEYESVSVIVSKGENNFFRLPKFNENFTPYTSSIKINGETVEVDVYDSRWPLSNRTTFAFAAERASFTYQGDSYNLTIVTQNENFNYSDFNFTTINTANEEDLRFIEDRIVTGYENY